MTIFAYKDSANGVTPVTAMQANATLLVTDRGGDGIEFLEPSDATAGVDFDLPPSVITVAAGSVAFDGLQSFEALILIAFADLIDIEALSDIR